MQSLATRIDGPVAVIGDLHGQVDKLLSILEKLQAFPDYERRWIVFIGDFVDRGPEPKGLLNLVTELLLKHTRTTAVCGNHDLAMAAALGLIPTPDYSNWSERWLSHYDAHKTFESYGVEFGQLEVLRDQLPEHHKEFLVGLPWCVEHPALLFVHAGLDPNTPFDIQVRILRQKDFSLNRPQWLCSKSLVHCDVPHDCPLVVVSGHVQVPHVISDRHRLLIDTTGGLEGDLSCVLWPENQVITSGADPATPAVQAPRSWWKLWKSGDWS